MRVLFTALAAYGHVHPLLPLAVAAREQGHEVAFATGRVMHDPLRAAGFEPIDAGASISEAGAEAARDLFGTELGELSPEQLPAVGAAAFGTVLPRRFLADLEPVLARFEPDLVVFEAATGGAELAARRAGVPAVAHGVGPAVDKGFEEHREQLAAVAAEVGLPVGKAAPYLDIYPPSLQDPAFRSRPERIEMRPRAFAEAGELPEPVLRRNRELGRNRQLVYLTFGTGFGTAETLRRGIDALAPLEADVLVAAGPAVDVAQLGDVPGNVLVERWVPQARLMPHIDLLVHHGGSGTTLGALSAGVPQLVLPRGADQFVNAAAVHDSGAGARLLPDEADASAIGAAARSLLADDRTRQLAGRISAEIAAMPAPEELAGRLPELARLS